ncbi:MAG: tetratricopeptide repeat protein [Saprospiraceae bacterium]|nr:tetratricopeptide repeat protein [Saprospiraceae bacterium]
MRLHFILFILLIGTLQSVGQNPLLDSLLLELDKPLDDTTRVLTLAEAAWELKIEDPNRARHLLQDAICLTQEIGYLRGEATAFNYFGVLETIHDRNADAIRYYTYALPLRERLGDRKGVASIYNNLGNIYENQGEGLEALASYQLSLKILEQLGDSARIARATYSMAVIHESLGNYPEALNQLYDFLGFVEPRDDKEEIASGYNLIGNIKSEIELTAEAMTWYHKARVIREQMDDIWSLAITYQNLGITEDNLGEQFFDKDMGDSAIVHHHLALEWLDKAFTIYSQNDDPSGRADILNNRGVVEKNLGSAYLLIGDKKKAEDAWVKALEHLTASQAIREELGDQVGVIETLNGLGDVARRQGRYRDALQYTNTYFDLATALDIGKFIRNGWKDRAKVYKAMGNWQEAFRCQEKFEDLRWEEFNDKRVKDYERREVLYGDLKKQIKLEKQEQELAVQDARLSEARTRQRALMGGGLALALLALLLYNRYRIKNKANQDLEEKNVIIDAERKKSDDLLLNILPAATARELKETGRAQARHYDSVTVLFTDFSGFTATAAKLAPADLVAELDTCFRAFDAITGRHGIEKIKTIGDAFLCVGGLPEEREGHALDVVKAAQEMQTWMENRAAELEKEGRPFFRMRAGIHTGPVVAGVVGDRKFAYDIWGDTVNTAARMESNGEPGRINLSAATWEEVKGEINCTPRGAIEAKGKGKLEMYFVEN